MNNSKIVFIPALAILTIFMSSCSENVTTKEQNNDKPIVVEISSNTNGAVANGLSFTGQVESAHSANVATRMMGYITKIYVKAGDRVQAGQLLFTINSSDIRAKQTQVDAMLKQAEAALHVAQKDFDRYTALYKQNSASAKELEQITLQYQSAKAGVEAAKGMQHEVSSQLAYANVVAPFNGIVTQKLADEGSLANPGMPILTIEQGGTLQITAMVPENDISQVKLGQEADVQIEAANKNFKTKLSQINPSSQFSGGQYIVKLAIPANELNALMAGMYATVRISTTTNSIKSGVNIDTTKLVMLPKKALVYRDQLVGVYTVSSEKTALLRWLRIGKELGDKVEVLSGITRNEPYIVKADGNLYNGAKLTIK